MNIDAIALERAKRVLQRGFDAEAYIVMVLAEKRVDAVPSSNVDEGIDAMQKEFLKYSQDKERFNSGAISENELLESTQSFLYYIRKLLIELKAEASCVAEKHLIDKFLETLAL